MNRTLTRRDRIRRRPEFLRVQRRGHRVRGRFLTLFVLPSGGDVSRLGIIATRRLGGAVRRNRCKRLVREIFRQNGGRQKGPALDIVVMPRPGFCDVLFVTLQADYLATVQRYDGSRKS